MIPRRDDDDLRALAALALLALAAAVALAATTPAECIVRDDRVPLPARCL